MEHRVEIDHCMPAVTHMHWDAEEMKRRIARWANHVARGREDLRQVFLKAELAAGGTIGPAVRKE